MTLIPENAKVLVIGGGPGGSYTASVLAREGIDVVVLEAEKFPRYHVGESQLASLRHFLRFIDLEDEFEAFGFQKKPGAGFKLNRHKREGFTDFVSHDPSNYSWNTVRSQADELMLRYAARVGASVFEEVKVTEIEFSGDRPVAAQWKAKDGSTGKISFDYVVDASGRVGIISTKYLKNREYNDTLKNVASWGYWSGTGKYLPGTPRENCPFFEALTDESGWAWFIPLHDGTTSVGLVMNQDKSNAKKSEAKEKGEDASVAAHYHRELQRAPNVIKLMGDDAKLIKKSDAPLISSASDYSYSAPSYAGPGYRIVGDAASFIDPYFSSGVHLALAGGLSASATICSVLRGECSEEDATKFHTTKIHTSFTRFLLVVLSAYQQIRHQSVPVLSSDKEDNFDRAFDFFRPIIQGNTETGKKMDGDNLNKTIEFVSDHAYEPSLPEERAAMMEKYGGDPNKVVGDDPEAVKSRKILKGMAIRKLMRTEEINHIDNFVSDALEGFILRLQRGNLGLTRVE